MKPESKQWSYFPLCDVVANKQYKTVKT